jgi:hypothetical protein
MDYNNDVLKDTLSKEQMISKGKEIIYSQFIEKSINAVFNPYSKFYYKLFANGNLHEYKQLEDEYHSRSYSLRNSEIINDCSSDKLWIKMGKAPNYTLLKFKMDSKEKEIFFTCIMTKILVNVKFMTIGKNVLSSPDISPRNSPVPSLTPSLSPSLTPNLSPNPTPSPSSRLSPSLLDYDPSSHSTFSNFQKNTFQSLPDFKRLEHDDVDIHKFNSEPNLHNENEKIYPHRHEIKKNDKKKDSVNNFESMTFEDLRNKEKVVDCIDLFSEVVIVGNINGSIIKTNNLTSKILGYENLTNQNISSLFDKHNFSFDLSEFLDQMNKNNIYSVIKSNGSIIKAKISLNQLANSPGYFLLFINPSSIY